MPRPTASHHTAKVTCAACLKDYYPYKNSYKAYLEGKTAKLYCSRKCYFLGRTKNIPSFECPICKIRFTPRLLSYKKHQDGTRKDLYCSRKCSDQGRKVHVPTLTCTWCKKKHTPIRMYYRKKLKQGVAVMFCSKSCARKKWRHVTYSCDNCSGNFDLSAGQRSTYNRGTQKHFFCSVDCSIEYRRDVENRVRKQPENEYSNLTHLMDLKKGHDKELF